MDFPKDEIPGQATFLQTFFGYLSAYGWHLVFFVLVINLIYTQFKPKVQKWFNERSDQQLAAEYHKNPDRLIAIQEALELSRQRMQEEHDRCAMEQAEKIKQREEEKRQEKIKQWECKQMGSSFSEASKSTETTSGVKREQNIKPKSSETPFRGQGYNPLMGSRSGACYRPSRHSGSAGG